MNFFKWDCFKGAAATGSTLFRIAFAFTFLLAAVLKFRLGFDGFAENLANPIIPTLISQEIPDFVLLIYGYLIPVIEFIAGVLLLVNKYAREAYIIIGLLLLTYIFGSMYNGNMSIVAGEYIPMMVALVIAIFCLEKS